MQQEVNNAERLEGNQIKEGGNKMSDKEKNVTIVNPEDKKFIQVLMSLSPEKKFFIKGIILGMETQRKLDRNIQPGVNA